MILIIVLFIIAFICLIILFQSEKHPVREIALIVCVATIAPIFLAAYLQREELHSQPKIDLPEEYMQIYPTDHIYGNYDPKTDSLHIYFDKPKPIEKDTNVIELHRHFVSDTIFFNKEIFVRVN